MERSHVATLTERVNKQHRERVAVLEASLGAKHCQALMKEGAAMPDNEAVMFARATVERALTSLAAEDEL